MIAQTSLFAYQDIKKTLTKRENEVLAAIRELGVACINEVAAYMEVFPNQISGRFTALKAKGEIEFVERKRMVNGSLADYYRVKGVTNEKGEYVWQRG